MQGVRSVVAVLVFLAVFIGALLFGALSAYPVFTLLSWFTEAEFHRVISRTCLSSGLLFSFLYLRYYGLLSFRGLALKADRRGWRIQFFIGLLAGALVLGLLVSILLLLGIYHLDPRVDTSINTMLVVLAKALLAGLLVGLIEELIFRGALFSGLKKNVNAMTAVILTSLVYALVHFLKFRALPENTEIHWLTGIEMFPAALFRFRYWPTLDASITLFILGILLATIRLRSGSILPCIGMHAGIVIVLKVFFYLANYTVDNDFAYLVNEYDPQFGILASVLLALTLAVYVGLSGTKRSNNVVEQSAN